MHVGENGEQLEIVSPTQASPPAMRAARLRSPDGLSAIYPGSGHHVERDAVRRATCCAMPQLCSGRDATYVLPRPGGRVAASYPGSRPAEHQSIASRYLTFMKIMMSPATTARCARVQGVQIADGPALGRCRSLSCVHSRAAARHGSSRELPRPPHARRAHAPLYSPLESIIRTTVPAAARR
jgi:hypothetical protein